MEIFLHPGDYFVGNAGDRIHTILGSCVSIMLWHPVKKIGALSHFLLSDRAISRRTGLNGHYGEEAMCLMVDELQRLHVSVAQCQGKIFGGGNMFPMQATSDVFCIGRRNGETARRLLRSHRVPIVSESLFGEGHRKIIFDVASGLVWSRHEKLAAPCLPAMQAAA